MEHLFILLMILIFAFRGISKIIEASKRKKLETPEPTEEELEEYFESIELPPVAIPEEKKPPEVKKAVAKKKIEEKPLPKKKEEEPVKAPLPKTALETRLKTLTPNYLRQGIILSIILGPPKAHRRLTKI